MNGIAALAAKEVVAASGLGAGLLPGVAPSAVDGFAAGTLLSGVCFLLIVAPRHGLRRPRLSARGRSLPDPAEAIDIAETTACTPADGPGYAAPAAEGYASAPALGYAPAAGYAARPARLRARARRYAPRPRPGTRPDRSRAGYAARARARLRARRAATPPLCPPTLATRPPAR